MKRLGIVGMAAVVVSIAGCSRDPYEERDLSKLAHCAQAAELHAAALERYDRLNERPEKHKEAVESGAMPAYTASKTYRAVACEFDPTIPR